MTKLRLTTQGRFALSGFTAEVREVLTHRSWRVYGDLENTSTLLLTEDPKGINLGKDGRLFVADGQNICNVSTECELKLAQYWPLDTGRVFVFTIVGREPPSPEKLAHMLANPTKPPGVDKLDPEQQVFFDQLTPQKKG